VQSENVNLTPGEMRTELVSALHDPAVQRLLREDPELNRRLVLELAQMQMAAGTDSLPTLQKRASVQEFSSGEKDSEAMR
jgi:hypothetical protein